MLVVDQFEELFVAGGDAKPTGPSGRRSSQRCTRRPPSQLTRRHSSRRWWSDEAVRADYLGRLIADPTLKAWVDAGLFTVGPMSEAELRLAITGPAAEAGLTVEPALVDAVITDVRAGAERLGSGVLPLMSQAMAATSQRREGSKLTLRREATGVPSGVSDAVNRSAQAAYDALTSKQKDAARLVSTQLTVITDGQFARRRCRRPTCTPR